MAASSPTDPIRELLSGRASPSILITMRYRTHLLRATYIINPDGFLRHCSQNGLGVGRNVDEIYRLVTAFQFVEEEGQVCPSKWKKKGDAAMKGDHEEGQTLDYFKKVHGDSEVKAE